MHNLTKKQIKKLAVGTKFYLFNPSYISTDRPEDLFRALDIKNLNTCKKTSADEIEVIRVNADITDVLVYQIAEADEWAWFASKEKYEKHIKWLMRKVKPTIVATETVLDKN